MQQAHESLTPRSADDETRRSSGLPPVKTFLVLVLIVIAVLAAAVATRPATPPASQAAPAKPDFSLSNEEAIARFEELHKLFRQASMHRDLSLLPVMLTPDSKLHAFATKEIKDLKRDNVLDRSVFRSRSVQVTKNTPTEIGIEQHVIVRPRFLDDATLVPLSTSDPVRERVNWTLMLDETVWKVHDVLVVDRKHLKT